MIAELERLQQKVSSLEGLIRYQAKVMEGYAIEHDKLCMAWKSVGLEHLPIDDRIAEVCRLYRQAISNKPQ